MQNINTTFLFISPKGLFVKNGLKFIMISRLSPLTENNHKRYLIYSQDVKIKQQRDLAKNQINPGFDKRPG